jgi:sulfatase modifying factor 1
MDTSKCLCLAFFLFGCHIYGNAQEAVPKDGFIQLKGGEYPLGKDSIPITLSPFAISPTEVTYGQMSLFALQYGKNPKRYHYDKFGEPDAERAAVNVDWFDAIRYSNWLSKRNGLGAVYTVYGEKGVLNPEDESYWDNEFWTKVDSDLGKKGYRLPTEAEWEYAASGYGVLGRKQEFFGTDEPASLKEYAWYRDNSEYKAQKPGLLKPNANGIYDMGGNVWEWCFDEYKRYFNDEYVEPFNNPYPFFQSGQRPYETNRSTHGGSWYSNYYDCRVSYRIDLYADYYSNYFGFRLARTL